ncbi:helix-turn-helix domain-containing protein [Ancylomarina longa]|uniref:AraC family transcriptional regulator n=1 Tax=Ancylomarina longa TaxID=2487017 RepID=A0A434AYA1_9BACT|nr:AraC family transcriptional regulator [Ancylomarina longa]RUT79421.1 AraC family transcriptional regulator [Ancylomarina longa]
MKTFHFKRKACGVELSMNMGTYDHFPSDYATGEMHNTDYFEILIFSKANGYMILDQKHINLKDRLIIFISPFQRRQWFLNSNDIHAEYLIFQEDFLNDFFSDKLFTFRLQYFYQLQTPLALNANDVLFDKVKRINQEIKEELLDYKCDSEHLIRSLLYFLLIRINRDYALHYQLDTKTQINNYAYQFKQLLEKYICEKQRTEDYAELMGISRITLNKAVKIQFNLTSSQLIKDRLLFEIENLLIYSELSISEISEKLNFSEANHLNRFFKHQTGLTPLIYRQDYQNGSL